MHCPHTVIAWRNSWVYIVRHDGADYRRVPWRVRLNLLRYEIQIGPVGRRFTINRDGRAALWLANLIWRLKGNAA